MWYNKSSDTNPSKILNKEYTITIVLKKIILVRKIRERWLMRPFVAKFIPGKVRGDVLKSWTVATDMMKLD